MRFKKLKISVAVALVLFVLVVGNIYILGSITRSPASTNSDTVSLSPPTYVDKTPTVQPSTQPSQIQPAPSQPEPTIVHRTIVSRAS